MMQHPPERIHLIFKTHLDLGYTELAAEVVTRYFTVYIPNALHTARRLREQGSVDRFIWTTGSWLIYHYLEQASSQERRLMEAAIAVGDVSWHGLPFTTHSELMDASLFRSGLRLAHHLDARFGTHTIAAKMTDVPGHTRGIVPLLAEAGITWLHIGVNGVCTPPAVPPVFVWRDPSGAEVTVMYQAGYGEFGQVPGSSAALAFAHTLDNVGPQALGEVPGVYQQLRARFPQAQIRASTLNAFAEELAPVQAQLPVVTKEIGDTWIHGAGSDPLKMSQFRALSRLRRHWLATGRLQEGEPRTERFSQALLLIPEHTWGLDVKTYLDDYTQYLPEQLKELRKTARVQHLEASWQEQRTYVQQALAALEGSPEAEEAWAILRALAPQPIDRTIWHPVQDWSQRFQTEHFILGFDPSSGAVNYLRDTATGYEWASEYHPLALVRYELFSQHEYDRFWAQYIVDIEQVWGQYIADIEQVQDAARKDFTKPGIEQCIEAHTWWRPQVTAMSTRQDEQSIAFLLEMRLPEQCTALGAPRTLALELVAPRAEPTLQLNLQWGEKQATRLPEALWCSFQPRISTPAGWSFSKLGTTISPLEVISRGNRSLHAVEQEVSYQGREGSFLLETLDAPLIAPGKPSLLEFADEQPDLLEGIHCNLYNNVWGTNFPLWYEEDARFRFLLRFG